MQPQTTALSRNPIVDYLRALCIGLVIAVHYCGAMPHDFGIPADLQTRLVRNGYYGVTGFFVISGYLITTTSIKRYGRLGAVSIPGFYWNRFCRIAPPLLATVGTLLGLHFAGAGNLVIPNTHSIQTLLEYVLTFRANLYARSFGYLGYGWDILWSLAIEECFYLVFPWVCRVIKYPIIIGPLLISLVIYSVNYRATHGLYDYLSCFDQIGLGFLVAIIVQRPKVMLWLQVAYVRYALFAAGAIGFTVTFLGAHVDENKQWGPLFIGLSMASLLLYASQGKGEETRSGKNWFTNAWQWCVAYCGSISYEIYLIHGMVIMYLASKYPFFHLSNPRTLTYTGAALFFPIVLVSATSFSRFFAIPSNRILRRLA